MSGILTRKGINAQRRTFSKKTNRDDEMVDLVASSPTRFLHRAVVVDVIFDVAVMPELIKKFEDDILNPAMLSTAPRNSIIARVVSGGADRRSSAPAVFYPTHSHTHEPIKPGEHAWVFYEDPTVSTEQGFWLSRIVEPIDVDDPNFTHADRKFVDDRQPTTVDRLQELGQLQGLDQDVQGRLRTSSGTGPRFPNGGETEESLTLNDIDGYDRIEAEAVGNRVLTKEPVPRYSKRPGEWAAEGSNNALLVLGEDRTSSAAKAQGTDIKGRPDDDKKSLAGMFDLVLGRGMDGSGKLPAPGSPPVGTSPVVVKNARSKLETDKSPTAANPAEGGVDFENDLTRLYGSMDTDVDGNFGKALPNLSGGRKPDVIDGGPAVIAKSDHVRVIAREDGSIRIVKEGEADDEGGTGRAVIIIEKDGTIMIDGPHIIIGSGIQKAHGAGTQIELGRDATEPIVLGNALKDLLTQYTDNIQKTFEQTLNTVINAPGVGLAPGSAGSFGNFGIPLPGMAVVLAAFTLINGQVTAHTKAFQQQLDKMLSQVGKAK